ncbi:MAG: hypothetical protein KGI56_08505 [Acidobacteriota bacterium]|nr:hypothetical protein [Acidobacteriota bacterium]
MTDASIQTTLTPEEWKFVLALRDIPESPLRDKVSTLFTELVRFIEQPRCMGMQSDGFPCGTPHTSCEECQQMFQVLDDLTARLPRLD